MSPKPFMSFDKFGSLKLENVLRMSSIESLPGIEAKNLFQIPLKENQLLQFLILTDNYHLN